METRNGNESALERYFKLKERGTDARTEFTAGLTTFLTMAYILAVNPIILSATGMPKEALFTATAVSAGLTTILMGVFANLPFALASGMGLNAYFATLVLAGPLKGVPNGWQIALTCVLLDGVIFTIISLFKIRTAIVNAIPVNIKRAISVGIGMFIASLGFMNAGAVKIVDNHLTFGSYASPQTLLFVFGLLITGIMMYKKIKGSLLWGIIITAIIGWIYAMVVGPETAAQFGIFEPSWNHLISMPPSVSPIAFKFDFKNAFTLAMLPVIFAFFFVDMFDTIGTFIGCAQKAKLVDEKGNMSEKDTTRGLLTDAIGTMFGACLGTSTVTTYIESSSGIAEGGRTGLTSVVTGLFFIIALFLSNIFTSVPAAATAPALVIVGLLMISVIKDIDLSEDWTEALPAFLTIAIMPFTASISEGIVFGVVSYTLLKVFTGKAKEVSGTMYVLAAVFIVYLIFR
ncbi:MAG: NCS2 family permease [Thermoanaerobacteraceae bacterium]|nr:NCS2 family permease [Thermoanaerobacteraceae bacterium]